MNILDYGYFSNLNKDDDKNEDKYWNEYVKDEDWMNM